MKTFGMDVNHPNIKELRQNLNLSQAKLSEITGISQYCLSEYETGKKNIPKKDYFDIIKILKDDEIVKFVTTRKKRYKEHTFEMSKNNHNDRSKLCKKTQENQYYLDQLSILYEQHLKNKKKFSAISLFSGIGGLSLGFSAASVKIKANLELDETLRKIYKDNFPDCYELGGDIRALKENDIKLYKQNINNIDFIIGGPPCQGFSLSGKRDVSDSRNLLFKEYIKFVKIIKPKIALMENVRVLTSMKDKKGNLIIDEIYTSFQKLGYNIKHFEINAKDYGVPQHRERVIFIAYNKLINEEPSLPPFEYENDNLFLPKPRTFADACSDLEYLESGGMSKKDKLHCSVTHPDHVIKWLWDVKEGCSAHDNKQKILRPPSGYNTTYKRQIWNEPASTVQTTFGMISGCRNVHPIATRSLTVREAARIQSFPDEFIFNAPIGSLRTGIGNAVPPLLAYIIAKYLTNILVKYDKNI